MGPIWGRQDAGGPHVGTIIFTIWEYTLGARWYDWFGLLFKRPITRVGVNSIISTPTPTPTPGVSTPTPTPVIARNINSNSNSNSGGFNSNSNSNSGNCPEYQLQLQRFQLQLQLQLQGFNSNSNSGVSNPFLHIQLILISVCCSTLFVIPYV